MERNEVALTHAALFEKFLQSKPIVVDKKRFLPIETLREKYKSWIEVSNSVLMKSYLHTLLREIFLKIKLLFQVWGSSSVEHFSPFSIGPFLTPKLQLGERRFE